jgi:hypothetical protein
MTPRYLDQARFERLDKRRTELKSAARAMEAELIRFTRSPPPPHLSHSEIEAEKARLLQLRRAHRHEYHAVDLEISELAVVEDDEGEDD